MSSDDMAVDLYLNIAFARSSIFLSFLFVAGKRHEGDQRARGYSKWALGLNVAALISLLLTALCLIIYSSVTAVRVFERSP